MKIKFFKTKGLCGELIAVYKGVEAVIASDKNWVSIYAIQSKNKNKGEAQEFINELKKIIGKKELWSSVPINNIWKHICNKLQIKYNEHHCETMNKNSTNF